MKKKLIILTIFTLVFSNASASFYDNNGMVNINRTTHYPMDNGMVQINRDPYNPNQYHNNNFQGNNYNNVNNGIYHSNNNGYNNINHTGYYSRYRNDPSFRRWLRSHPNLANAADSQQIDSLYSRNLEYKRDVVRRLSPYRNEIWNMPEYRRYQNPVERFAEDFINKRLNYNPYNLSQGLSRTIRDLEIRREALLRAILNYRAY